MRAYFDQIFRLLNEIIRSPTELVTVYYEGESTDFCRMNHNLVRQAGNVEQHVVRVQLIQDNKRHAGAIVTLTNEWEFDRQLLTDVLQNLRKKLASLPDDPYLFVKEEVESTEENRVEELAPVGEMIDTIRSFAAGLDLVGILASGKIYRGFGNTHGQINWFETSSVNFDWSIYDRDDKAIKENYTGTSWDSNILKTTMDAARHKLPLLKRPSKRLQTGNYRVFMSPSALDEIWELVSWEGFGLKYLQTKNSPLQTLYDGRSQLDERIQLNEDVAGGINPVFNDSGFIRPASLSLISAGRYGGALISPRSAQEFQADCNGADVRESPVALSQHGGQLATDQILTTLDRGLYISNLWYLNFSDHSNCRMTGMTRFATFWVEDGELKEPVDVMRFDESLFRMLGSNLVDLTKESTLLASASTYDKRSTMSRRLPGVIVDDFRFTL